MILPPDPERRRFVKKAALAAAAVSLTGRLGIPDLFAKDKDAEEVLPAEDLMREHGVLDRLLLIYENCAKRLAAKRAFPLTVLGGAADLMKRFIEDYHEKQEEEELFPRFEKAGKLTDLVRTLRAQHDAGRKITDRIRTLTAAELPEGRRQDLVTNLEEFLSMYRPHAAREDTVLFPAIREIVSADEYRELGEKFEDKEHQMFGEKGFEKIVADVAGLEKSLGIYELDQFTPKA